MGAVYGGIDLHGNNSVVALIDEQGKRLYRYRHANELRAIERALAPYRKRLKGVAVESTFNWYWLVDGLMEKGYPMRLANPAAIQQYKGLKHGDDGSDALWLAEMVRLGILPEGYIYPRQERAVRDLLRKRAHLVRQQTANVLSMQNIVRRTSALRVRAQDLKKMTAEEVLGLVGNADVARAVEASQRVSQCLEQEIKALEKIVRERVKLRAEFAQLKSIPGVGDILALTIMLESGEMGRFLSVGKFSSYCRCVDSKRVSNGKKKGEGNVKNGNKYLGWAFVEAANFAVRFAPAIRRWHQRKKARTNPVLATKAVAHKLARAAYYVLRDQVPFEVSRAFC
jgi:transposase